jgi:hypothetical protein
MKDAGGKLFKPVSKVQLLLSRFQYDHRSSNTFVKNSYTEFDKIMAV